MEPSWLLVFSVGVVAFFIGRITARVSDAVEFNSPQTLGYISSLSAEGRLKVETEIRNRRIVDAVKAFREDTGSGLRDAKHAVDTMAKQLN